MIISGAADFDNLQLRRHRWRHFAPVFAGHDFILRSSTMTVRPRAF